MITPRYAQTMAAYNAEMNRRLYASAGRLTEDKRRRDRGAFWRSIHATLSHLLWADRTWMSRLDGWPQPDLVLGESGDLYADFETMAAVRPEADARIAAWATQLTETWLAEDLTWYSGAAQREMTLPRTLVVTHLFNHQTHHRGQVHAMLTAAGETTGATDLPLVLA